MTKSKSWLSGQIFIKLFVQNPVGPHVSFQKKNIWRKLFAKCKPAHCPDMFRVFCAVFSSSANVVDNS